MATSIYLCILVLHSSTSTSQLTSYFGASTQFSDTSLFSGIGVFSRINMVAVVVARTGRQLQRYNGGQRVVVGCIPYRLKSSVKTSGIDNALEVLVISAQRKGKGMLFPKGGWELDEKIQEAALRETIEEAGVSGTVESELGKWCFKSKGNDAYYEGHMFPLLVKEQLDQWPEKHIRERYWVSASKAKESCQYSWMREALDLLVTRLESTI